MTSLRVVVTAAMTIVLSAGLGACGSDQDPGVTPGTGGGPTTTSHLLERCPDGGPNATTPSAGCLDEDGKVAH